ncbi:hypothetical protein PV755_45330 [Streptomyces caniscabiei]|uniref:Uncharacterized protein n=1 Tax=Streptomyces caniscabiei TaxID=2746961 RepID=A0A927QE48_9ACTN|nr:hypothetical protein [Streptomyces caniscabiei]MBD9723463.1 hypothetical protein [Streptomyces caniscabiei]MDX3516039.1 hypothetical protein [Streptomyces caniscabiei]MDX3725155.1 hypothetical protein [Streptomyces caniscabiei]WEO27033.1 hypothetical protein IHE65_29900 [Streptomyces caniscabiei]
MTTQGPTLDEIAAAGARRQRDADRLKQSSDTLKELVLDALRDGEHRPTDVTKASGWTAAHVRKMAREAGIEPDARYKDRADRLRKTPAPERPVSSEETTT